MTTGIPWGPPFRPEEPGCLMSPVCRPRFQSEPGFPRRNMGLGDFGKGIYNLINCAHKVLPLCSRWHDPCNARPHAFYLSGVLV